MQKKNKAIKRFKKEQKQLAKSDPTYRLKSAIVQSANNDNVWAFPFISLSEHTSDLAVKQNLDVLCNQERKATIKLARNGKRHPSLDFRNSLKKYFDLHKSIYWQAVISDITMPKPSTHNGFLLLDHVLMRKFDKDKFSIMFNNLLNQIDYHIWISIDQIKYFGNQNTRKIAIGDMITGQSFIERYRDSNRQEHYSLGKTIIEHCGIPLIDDYYLDGSEVKAINARIIDNYDRKSDWVVKLEYPSYYQSILGRYKTINMKTLQFIKGDIWSYYQPSKYSKFFTLNDKKIKFRNYQELSNAVLGKNKNNQFTKLIKLNG